MNLIDLEALIQTSYELEPLPASISRLASLVAQENSDMNDIERIVSHDPALTGRVLRAANSAANAAGTTINTARAAVMRIGVGGVLSLALGARVGRRLQREVPEYGLQPGQLWRHAVASSLAIEVLGGACRSRLAPETATAALLHDIGKSVLCQALTPALVELLQQAHQEGRALRDAESEILGVHHGEVGGLIAQHWRLPDGIVLGITHHHTPELVDHPVPYAVQIADAVAKAAENPDEAAPPELLDRAMNALGMDPAAYGRAVEVVARRLPSVIAAYG